MGGINHQKGRVYDCLCSTLLHFFGFPRWISSILCPSHFSRQGTPQAGHVKVNKVGSFGQGMRTGSHGPNRNRWFTGLPMKNADFFNSELLNYQRVMWLYNNKPPIWEWLKSHLFTFFQWGFQLESWCEIRLSFPYLFNLVSHVTFECKGRHIRTNQRLFGLYCNIFVVPVVQKQRLWWVHNICSSFFVQAAFAVNRWSFVVNPRMGLWSILSFWEEHDEPWDFGYFTFRHIIHL